MFPHLFNRSEAKISKKGLPRPTAPETHPEIPMPTAPGTHPIDLRLPRHKRPSDLKKLSYYSKPQTVKGMFSKEHRDTSYAIGSSTSGEKVYYEQDLGLFQSVYEAWKNHYNLRTSPEDWWFPVACKIAKAVDKAAKSTGSEGQKVRDLFVDHEGKEKICVDVNVFTLDQVDPDAFFSAMSSQIASRIKVPEYAEAMQNDFSTSATTYRIASQINLMASMQEFFSYEMGMCGCGIKGLEMLGKQEDWDKLAKKLRLLKKQLNPIQDCLCWELDEDWWSHVEHVFNKLAATYAARSNHQLSQVADFWANAFMIGDGWKYGPSGMNRHTAKEYNGWLVKFLTGYESILEEDFFEGRNLKRLRGLNSVPMKITKKYLEEEISDDANLTAGIMGFEIHMEDTFNGVPSLQPHHMWALELPTNSPLRS